MKPFELVIKQHGPDLLRYCIGRLGPDRGEDCFQETMLVALGSYEDLRNEDALRSWLFTIASRKAIDAYRSSDRLPSPTDQTDTFEGVDHDHRPGSTDIWTLLEDLPEKQSEALLLRYRVGMSHREVGAVMGTSEDAARRNSFEGIKRLRKDRSSWS